MNNISEGESLDLAMHLGSYTQDKLRYSLSRQCVPKFLQKKPLPKSYFLEKLSFEMRRSERYDTSLSIVIFHFDDQISNNFHKFKSLFEHFQNAIRETDTLGYLDKDIIGLLLPDTNEEGKERCIEKIVDGYKRLPFTMVSGTYPDQIFDIIIKEGNQIDLLPFFFEDLKQPNRSLVLLKRGIDIIGSLIGILLFSPLMLVTFLVIKATSPGPAIFKQIRLGYRGVPFHFYKFRSMFLDADDRIHREYVDNLIKGNLEVINQGNTQKPLYKIKSDPRVTSVGRFIRKTSIDELPQLFNVLKGEMSLVGPRPPLPYEAKKYQSWHLRRILEIKPGITGLWQVEGRSQTSFDDMVRLDLKYCRHWSLLLDLKILIKTIKVVFQSAGAF